MNAENLRGDDCSDRETVENVDESFPDLDVASSFAFVVESVHCRATDSESAAQQGVRQRAKKGRLTPSNVCTFVVSSKEEEVFGILDLVAEEEKDSF